MKGTESYIPDESKAVFVGTPEMGSDELFPYLSQITGLHGGTPTSYDGAYSAYYKYIMAIHKDLWIQCHRPLKMATYSDTTMCLWSSRPARLRKREYQDEESIRYYSLLQ